MNDEKKVLSILAIVFGGLALSGSWMPFINNLSFLLAILALILGIIALVVNRKNKKTLSIVGTSLSVASIIIVLITQSMYSNAIDQVSKSIDSASSSIDTEYSKSSSVEASQEAEADSNFKWTKSYFDNVIDGGIGVSTTYDDIVSTVGEPNSVSTSTDYDFDSDSEIPTKDCDWDLENGSYYASVSIHFIERDGTYVVDSKSSTGLK